MPPQGNGGLGSLLSQLGELGNLVGNRQPVEFYLVLARSYDVALDVVKRLNLRAAFGSSSESAATRKLAQLVDIHSLRGGVIEIEVTGKDETLALSITTAYATAFQNRLTFLARDQGARKKALMNEQLIQASTSLALAETEMSKFRTLNHLASPELQLGSSVSLLSSLRARLEAKEVELATMKQFATSANITYQRITSEISGLHKQIAKAENSAAKDNPLGFQKLSANTSEYVHLYRNLKYAEALYEAYSRSMEAVNVENASATINAQIVESPHLDPHVQWRPWPIGLVALILLLAIYMEMLAAKRIPGAFRW